MKNKITKLQLIEASITMDTDTFNKNKGILDKEDKVTLVPKGSIKTVTDISETDEMNVNSDAVEYGYEPELDGDKWEEFLKILKQSDTPHETNLDDSGQISEVKLKRKDFNKLNENKKWL